MLKQLTFFCGWWYPPGCYEPMTVDDSQAFCEWLIDLICMSMLVDAIETGWQPSPEVTLAGFSKVMRQLVDHTMELEEMVCVSNAEVAS